MDEDTYSGPGWKDDVDFTMATHLNNDITDMKSDITDMNNDITDMKSDITDTNNDITDKNSDITDMNSDIITDVSPEDRHITEKEQGDTSAPPVNPVCHTEIDSEDSDSDSSSSSSDSSSPALVIGDDEYDEGYSQPAPVRTRDEVLLEELPAVEEVCVSLPDDVELKPVGTISAVIKQLVIVQSLKDTPPLSDDSIIFTADRLAVGKVFEVFGPVSSPLYILRVSSSEQLSSRGLTEGLTLYYAPENQELTGYVLTQQLRLFKGSDASWKNDQEPPEEALDFSDDEKEKEAKTKAKKKRRADNNTTGLPAQFTPNTFQQQQQRPDVRTFSPRHSVSSQQQRSHRGKQSTFGHTFHHQTPPTCLPPPCPYPPPMFSPPAFSFYPPPPPLPPPGAPPSFFSPSWSTPVPPPPHLWHLFSDLSSPPPPPPPPPPQ